MNRIILARPAVEAGERLGFLPGTLQQKIDPYMRPLYDALYDLLDADKLERFLDKGIIEVAPLAFMRGRTLNDSFVILDEAQNTTSEQMKMFLTRLGFNSKAVITGDITQIDLPAGRRSGLVEAIEVVGKIEGIAFVYFNERDVVRHNLVQQIIKAYDEFAATPSRQQRSSRRRRTRVRRALRIPANGQDRRTPDSRRLAAGDDCELVSAAFALALAPLAEFLRACATRTCGFPESSVTVRFVSDPAMARLNRRLSRQAGPTDVLSFPGEAQRAARIRTRSCRRATERSPAGRTTSAISPFRPETARRNARRGIRAACRRNCAC